MLPSKFAIRQLAFLLSLMLSSVLASTGRGQEKPVIPVPTSVTKGLEDDIRFLASEELRGRSVTDDTIHEAANYLEQRMRGIGLSMTAADGDAFQSVKISVGSEVASTEKNICRFDLAEGNAIEATLQDGFGPLAVGKDVAQATGRLVFAGYGITSDQHSYDDYQGIDASGAIVMILRKEPQASDPDSPFNGVQNTRHAYFATKIANAIQHGAVGVLLVNDPRSARDAAAKEQNRIDQEIRRRESLTKTRDALPEGAVNNRKTLNDQIESITRIIDASNEDLETARRGVLSISEAGTKTKESRQIPIGSIARDLADRILVAAGAEGLEDLENQIDEKLQPASRSLESVTAELSVDLKPAVVASDNVIGVIPGRGSLGGETVIVGAHYDHVGMGGYASLAPGTIAVHNGADDNASGTATMLACAAMMKDRLQSVSSYRTMMFIGFTGEERGLVGSQYYVDHPLQPLSQVATMINLDMVGRLRDNELTVYGTGTAPEMDGLVEQSNKRFGFNLFKVASGFGPSDHQSFYRMGVPVLFFFTGLHNDYHRPSDDFDKIDFGDLTRVTDIVSDVAFQLAVLPQRPRYAETSKRVQIRRQMTAYLGVRVSISGGVVRLTEVTEGGPASKSGLKIGDELQRIGNTAIRSTNDVISWVRAHGPGDTFEIVVRRNEEPVTVRGKLEKRPNG